jgi:hypothetical protein
MSLRQFDFILTEGGLNMVQVRCEANGAEKWQV